MRGYSRYVRSCSTEPARTGNPPTGRSWRTCAASRPVFLTFDTQNLSPETAEQQKEYRQSILAKTSPRDLVRIILRQPIIRLSETQINTGSRPNIRKTP